MPMRSALRAHLASDLSPAMEDYLKIVYRLSEEKVSVATQEIADRIGVTPASATHMIKRLAQFGLVEHRPYHGVQLTSSGVQVAEEMIRHHRLLELYLTTALGFTAEEVHREAELLEHYISETLEERIDCWLGRPTRDPHGSPIPSRVGREGEPKVVDLLGLALLAPARVVLCSQEAELSGFREGQAVMILGRMAGAKAHVRLDGVEQLVCPKLCQDVLVQPLP
jgi:DtxR family Mn-dependent transcriptional regulator